MTPRCFLHAGFHKTGTTAIQQFAARNRSRLKAGGIFYPRLWPATFRPVTGHQFLFHAVAGQRRHVSWEQARKLMRRWHRRAVGEGCAVLLSGEVICRYMPDSAVGQDANALQFAKGLKLLLGDFSVQPVLVIRRQDDFVRSLYQEHVAAGSGVSARLSFPEYLSGVAADKARFLERLRVFRDTFGTVKLLVYEDLAGKALPVAFLRELGIRGLEGIGAGPVRPSLSVPETLVKQQLNRWISGPHQNRLALMWLRSPAVQKILKCELGGCNTLWPDAATRADFVARFKEENGAIAREFLGQDGGLFPTFNDHAPSQVSPPDEAPVTNVLKNAAGAARWWLQLIIGRSAVSELMQ